MLFVTSATGVLCLSPACRLTLVVVKRWGRGQETHLIDDGVQAAGKSVLFLHALRATDARFAHHLMCTLLDMECGRSEKYCCSLLVVVGITGITTGLARAPRGWRIIAQCELSCDTFSRAVELKKGRSSF